MNTRTCKNCQQEKDLFTEFYKHHGSSYYHVCRVCKIDSSKRPVLQPKVKGFAALDAATKDTITKGIQEGKSIRKIAEEAGIKYHTLYSWVRSDQIHPVLVRQNAMDPAHDYELARLRNM